MANYPEDLKTQITKMSNYSRSSVKIQNMHGGDVIDGNTLQFRLPSNSLMDLSSFAIHAKMTCGATGGAVGALKSSYYPNRNLNIVRSMTIEVSNNTVCNIGHYDKIRDLLLNYSMGEANQKFIYGNTDPKAVVNAAGVTIGMDPHANAGFSQQITLDRWISFLSANPSYVDSSITGEIIITIQLVPAAECLMKNHKTDADVNAPSDVLSDIYATITKCQINDNMYFSSIQSALAANIPFRMKFNHFENATGATSSNQTTSVRIEVQSDSVDKVFFSFMHPSINAKQTTSKDKICYQAETNNHKYLQRSLEDVTGLIFN
ncbi:hypothetical protein T484DRAFT_1758266, partial [Baffinella frigidus]